MRLAAVALDCWLTGFEFFPVNLDVLYKTDLVHVGKSYAGGECDFVDWVFRMNGDFYAGYGF